ncbi:MAG: hypothetical protein LBG49_00100 [Mycoplasmataceae bacterium]|jgi:hypothetical protein|nr:hypothetical protein [Mycoplasmataceae bacterium]
MKENKEYEITKSNRRGWIGVTFQCHIINKGVNVAPKWFRDWAEAFKKENDTRWAENNTRWAQNDTRWARQEEFNKAQLEFNNEVKDFMKYVLNIFQRNNLK